MSRSAERTGTASRRVLALAVLGVLVSWVGGAEALGRQQSVVHAPVERLRLPSEPIDGPVASLEAGFVVTAERVVLPADVLFAFGSAWLDDAARGHLMDAVKELRTRTPTRIRVVGHTDARGPAAFNQRLSLRRARAVLAVLGARFVPDGPALEVEGRGQRDPVARNTRDGQDDPAGRARNRRVELRLG